MLIHYFRTLLTLFLLLSIFFKAPVIWAEGIGMVTGSATGTYIQFGKDIAKVAKEEGVDILVKESEGSLDNIRRLKSKENAAIAIVQSDLLGFLSRSKDPTVKRYSRNLKLIFPFYNEEVHLLAGKEIKSIEDLAGKRVVVGTKGSGNYLTSNNLLNMLQITPSQRMEMQPIDAVTAVLTKKADAMFYVSGKPVALFQNIGKMRADSDPAYANLVETVHFVPLDHEKMLNEYVRSNIGPADYKWVYKTIPTIAVKAALVGYDFSRTNSEYHQKRCRQLAKIGRAVRRSLDRLKNSGHPKWKEVTLSEETGIWEWDVCSRMDLEPKSDADQRKTEEKILDYLKQQP
ncbi:MAG: TAXI family TRAP transporter solute-binding subunit [Desulfobacteraceae bacterium]|jgi:TRAP transporter TAXI family solute receptor